MPAAVQFYHLTTTPLERALPKLLEKALERGFRVLLVAETDEKVEFRNQLLWTYDQDSFLPHGSAQDGRQDRQPILLSSTIEPLNGAKLLAVADGAIPPHPDDFERIIDLFDGTDDQAVTNARTRWTSYKNSGVSLSYMRQSASGGWEQKAVA